MCKKHFRKGTDFVMPTLVGFQEIVDVVDNVYVSTNILVLLTEYFVKHFSNGLGSSFELMEAGDIFGILIPICFAIGLGIGIIGSFIALNRQLAKIN